MRSVIMAVRMTIGRLYFFISISGFSFFIFIKISAVFSEDSESEATFLKGDVDRIAFVKTSAIVGTHMNGFAPVVRKCDFDVMFVIGFAAGVTSSSDTFGVVMFLTVDPLDSDLFGVKAFFVSGKEVYKEKQQGHNHAGADELSDSTEGVAVGIENPAPEAAEQTFVSVGTAEGAWRAEQRNGETACGYEDDNRDGDVNQCELIHPHYSAGCNHQGKQQNAGQYRPSNIIFFRSHSIECEVTKKMLNFVVIYFIIIGRND